MHNILCMYICIVTKNTLTIVFVQIFNGYKFVEWLKFSFHSCILGVMKTTNFEDPIYIVVHKNSKKYISQKNCTSTLYNTCSLSKIFIPGQI